MTPPTIEQLNERLAEEKKRSNDAWAAAQMEREIAEYWKKKAEAAIEECAKVCDEYAADSEQRKNEERGYWTEEAQAVFLAQKELAREIRKLASSPATTGITK